MESKKEPKTLIERFGDVLSDKFRVAPVDKAMAIKDKDCAILYQLEGVGFPAACRALRHRRKGQKQRSSHGLFVPAELACLKV